MYIDYTDFNNPLYPSSIQPYPSSHSWIELSASALSHNAQLFKDQIGSQNILAFVVKSNAYGHGLAPIIAMTEQINIINWLCTFSLSEALYARSVGSTKPILVLGYIDVNPAEAINKNIEFMIDSIEQVEFLNSIGLKNNSIFNIHLKIDTGLSRFGVPPHQAVTIVNYMARTPYLLISGIFTHLTESQDLTSNFTTTQLTCFNTLVGELKKLYVVPRYIHATNTAACLTTSHPYNFFRVGLGLYGLFPSKAIKEHVLLQKPYFTLQPVLTWKTKIIQIKQVAAYSYISYNRTHQVKRDTTLAIIPVGYSDGYDANLSNRASVIINNRVAPVLGRIAMNISIIDVTDIPSARVGDLVTLLGKDPHIAVDTYTEQIEIKNVRTLLTNLPISIARTAIP